VLAPAQSRSPTNQTNANALLHSCALAAEFNSSSLLDVVYRTPSMTVSKHRSHSATVSALAESYGAESWAEPWARNNRYGRQRTVTSQEADEARALHALGRCCMPTRAAPIVDRAVGGPGGAGTAQHGDRTGRRQAGSPRGEA